MSKEESMAKVLVIDDNEQLLELYREVLGDLGYEVFTADRGETGIQLARVHEPDCIMLDIMMADMDGLDALKELTRWDSSIPIIIITGFPSAENAIEALKRGAFDFLTKGCTLEEMIATTKRALERRLLYKENRELLERLQDANANLERKVNEATAKLSELNAFNQSILEGIDAGLLVANDTGTILFANSAARRMIGLSADQLQGQNLKRFGFQLELATPVQRGNTTPHVGAAIFAGDLTSVEQQLERAQRRAKYRLQDGTVHVFGYSISTPDYIPGAKRGFIVLFRDLTEMEELKLQIQRLQKLEALNLVVAGVAHEIKNPIAGIKSVASVLYENLDQDDPRREYVGRIIEETRRVTRLVDEFFSFSRPSKPRLEMTGIPDCVDRVVRLLSDTAKQKKMQIVTKFDPKTPTVRIDRDQIQQVILNLVMNSIEAMNKEGKIEIATDVHDYRVLGKKCVRVQVHDTGPGFPDDARHRLFDPFYTTKPSGMGLGLHICQSIALEHGGRIEAMNHPDGGALVSLYLPMARDAGASAATSS